MNLFKRKVGEKTIWYISYRDKNGNRQQKSTKTSKKAEALLELKKLEIEEVAKSKVLLKDFTFNFFEYETSFWIKKQLAKNKNISKDTALFKERILKKHILPAFGDLEIRSIKTFEIDKWLLNKDCANQTKNHILYTFSQVLKEAEYQEIIETNPCKKIDKYVDDHKTKPPLNKDTLEKLFPIERNNFKSVWPDFNWGVMFALMTSSGMRSGEARALQWKHVLWDMGAVLIEQGFSNSETLKSTKAGYGRGTYIPDRTITLLSDLREMTAYKESEHYIFCSAGGTPFNRKWVYDQFKRGVVRAGLEVDASPHSLRHTYNVMMRNLLAQKNLPESILRNQIGHKSERMTQNYDNAEIIEKMHRNELVKPVLNDFWG
ncbi:MAG: site-specific integrase [Spirochaetaceae bacterium]|nr:site-specific integrase [Spirochaetaceae bacterium]